MLCGWKIEADLAYFSYVLNVRVQVKFYGPLLTHTIPERLRL